MKRSKESLGAAAVALALASGVSATTTAQRAKSPPISAAPLAVELTDYARLPITGLPDGTGNNAGPLARINVMRQEPLPSGRLFVNDLTASAIRIV